MEPSCTIATTANRSRLSLQPVRHELPVSNAQQSISHKDPIDDTEIDGMTPEVPPLLYLLSFLSICKVPAHAVRFCPSHSVVMPFRHCMCRIACAAAGPALPILLEVDGDAGGTQALNLNESELQCGQKVLALGSFKVIDFVSAQHIQVDKLLNIAP